MAEALDEPEWSVKRAEQRHLLEQAREEPVQRIMEADMLRSDLELHNGKFLAAKGDLVVLGRRELDRIERDKIAVSRRTTGGALRLASIKDSLKLLDGCPNGGDYSDRVALTVGLGPVTGDAAKLARDLKGLDPGFGLVLDVMVCRSDVGIHAREDLK